MKDRFGILCSFSLLLIIAIAASLPLSGVNAGDAPLLSSISSVRSLTREQAALPYRVHLQGIVAFYDPSLPLLYISSEGSGIAVELKEQVPAITAGAMIDVDGISAPGNSTPIIANARIKVRGRDSIPAAPNISLINLPSNQYDSQLVSVQGLVQNAYQEGKYTVLDAYQGKSRIHFRIQGYAASQAASFIDAIIGAKGVLGITTDSARKPIGLTLWMAEKTKIDIVSPPPAEPNQIAVTSIDHLRKNWESSPPQHRIRIQGTVKPGDKESTLIVDDKTGTISATPLFSRPIAPGDEVDIIGFADLSSDEPRIINATYLRIKAPAIQSREEKGLRTLTTIDQIRKLDAKEAERGYPVRIKGVITYHNPQLSMTFIQNGENAIYIQSLDVMLHLEEGMLYEVEGFSAPGDFAPVIVKPKIRLIGKGQMPSPKQVTLEQLSTGSYDCLRVQVRGIVRSVQQIGNRWRLELFYEGEAIQVWTPSLQDSAAYSLQDAKISATGICSIQISSWGAVSGFRVNVPSLKDILVEVPAQSDPFDAPMRSIRDLFRYTHQDREIHRVKIQGTLLHQQPGKALYIKDGTSAITIPIDRVLPVNANDLIAVSGYPSAGDPYPTMEHVLVKRIGATPPDSPALRIIASMREAFHGDLVKIKARLVDHWKNSEGTSYFLQDLQNSNAGVEAFLENSSEAPSFRNGSDLEATGIYLISTKGMQKSGFHLLLRNAEDLKLIKNAPWWTQEYFYWAFLALLVLILSALAWAATLKKRVNQQTAIIQAKLEVEATLEKKYRDLFEASNDIVFACDAEGKIKSINPAGARLLGYGIDQLMQLDPHQLADPSALAQIKEWVEKKKSGMESLHLECELQARDGKKVPVEVNGDIIRENGEIVGAQGIARDITERKQAEEALRQSEEKLRQGQKLESIGRLAGGIAHDFNNILSAIMGFAELSTEEIAQDHPVNSYLDQIVKAAKRARDLVQQILTFSRKLERERKPIQLQPIIEEALKLLKATLPATIEISTKVDSDCGLVMADPTQMHQIILNLATNASHAMGANSGLMKIELEQTYLKTKLAFSFPEIPPGKYLRLSVSDTGPGITLDIQKRIFEPYFTTKSVGQGSGLGLAVVHGIVQSHGGGIVLISAPGHGACFQIYLPCCQEEEAPSAAPPPPTFTEKGKGRILVVDDEDAIVRLCQRSLEKLGYEVTGETRSVKALELFARNPRHFDLVVTDQTMPQMTGLAFAQELWDLRPDLPVIISTGYSEQITSERAAIMGFHTLLNKPYTASELAKAIHDSLLQKV